MNRDNQPVFNANRKVANFKDFSADVKKLGKVRRSFQPNSDRQNFPQNERNEVENNQWNMTENTRKYYDKLSKINFNLKEKLDASPQDIKDKFAEMAEKFEGLGEDSKGKPIADGFWENNKHVIEDYTFITQLIENANSFFEQVDSFKNAQNASRG